MVTSTSRSAASWPGSTPRTDTAVNGVVLDLFGTVAAPASTDRTDAAFRLANTIGCDPDAVERYLLATWQVRHDGTLPTVSALAEHFVPTVGGQTSKVQAAADELQTLGRSRLGPDTSVVHTLVSLRSSGYRLGILSDASAEIAAAWPTNPLASVVDAVVFSYVAGCTKPDQRLYARIGDELGVPAHETLYCGDGGGDELRGARDAGMSAVAVHRRGVADALAFGNTPWSGPVIDAVEQLPTYLAVCHEGVGNPSRRVGPAQRGAASGANQ